MALRVEGNKQIKRERKREEKMDENGGLRDRSAVLSLLFTEGGAI